MGSHRRGAPGAITPVTELLRREHGGDPMLGTRVRLALAAGTVAASGLLVATLLAADRPAHPEPAPGTTGFDDPAAPADPAASRVPAAPPAPSGGPTRGSTADEAAGWAAAADAATTAGSIAAPGDGSTPGGPDSVRLPTREAQVPPTAHPGDRGAWVDPRPSSPHGDPQAGRPGGRDTAPGGSDPDTGRQAAPDTSPTDSDREVWCPAQRDPGRRDPAPEARRLRASSPPPRPLIRLDQVRSVPAAPCQDFELPRVADLGPAISRTVRSEVREVLAERLPIRPYAGS